jgi:hypothetical protein
VTPHALLAAFRDRGFTLSATEGMLTVRPSSALTPGDRAVIVRHLPGLVAALATGPRDVWAAARLLTEADTLVERLGVSGTHPAVAAAAGVVCRAYAAGDLAAVRFVVAEFEQVVRTVAASSGGQVPPDRRVSISGRARD